MSGVDSAGSGEVEEPLNVKEQDRVDDILTKRQGAPNFYLLPCRVPRMRKVSSSS